MSRAPLVLAAGVFYPGGEHITGWRSPGADPHSYLDLDYWTRFAAAAEDGRFATLFLADELYVWDRFRSGIEHGTNVRLEPFTLLSALSQRTKNIGLAATVSTTYNEPFHVARKLASLDHLSGGRAAWNLVTSASDEEARNFGREAHLEHGIRYARGEEFVEVVNGLWDGWEDDAFVFDKASGRYADRAKLHVLEHRGEHFSVRGPLNIPRPVQGHPPLFQAGASEAGRALAGRTADAVFTLGGGSLAAGRDLYDDYRNRAVAAGRAADDLKVLPWFSPIIGDTQAHAEERFRELADLTPERVQVDLLAHYLGVDLGERDVDEPFTFDFDLEGFNQSKSGYQAIADLLATRPYTLRELAWEVLRKRFTVGTPDTLAAHLIERYEQRAAEGFILMAPTLPDTLDRFVEHIVPRLTDHGIYPREYAGSTLRENLGLERPAGRYAA